MRKFVIGAGAALAIWSSPTMADPQFSTAPLTGFSVANVTAVLTKLGAQDVKAGKSSNGEDIIGFSSGGIEYKGLIRACRNETGCLGLLLGVPVVIEKGAFGADLVNNFNDASPFGKAVRTPDGKAVILFHYVIADGGILESNLGANIAVFSILPQAFAKFASQQVVASADKPQVMPVNAPTTPAPAPALPMGLGAVTGDAHAGLSSSLKEFASAPAYKLPQ